DDHDTEHRPNEERHGPEEVPEPVYLLPVRDRGADAAEEGADLEVPDDRTVGDARKEELQERDGDEEPAPDDDGEDADDEAAHEEQRRLVRKQPGRERASPREIHRSLGSTPSSPGRIRGMDVVRGRAEVRSVRAGAHDRDGAGVQIEASKGR